jgi:hypothetical protein
MIRFNEHLRGKGSPEEIQRLVDEVCEAVTHALLLLHQHELDSTIGPDAVDGSYIADAKVNLVEALRDLATLEAYNDAPLMLTGSPAEFRREGVLS